jgi:adenylate cyclase
MSEPRVERRLAAILAADVAGYSRLMGADEEGTLAALRAVRRELGDPKIAEHRGRIVKTTGDGLLVEFASVVDAVRCAVEVQREMIVRNAAIPAQRRIEFRMGVNVGDIIIEDGDIFGDGVNIAARLEALAEPGGICLSAAAHEQVRDRLDIAFDDLGEQQVKNITRPVRVFRIPITLTLPTPSARAPSLSRIAGEGEPRRAGDAVGEGKQALASARQTVDRGAALRQYERRSRAGIFRRRHGRGDHYRALAHPLALCHRQQFELHLQGPSDRREAGWP